MNFKSLIAALFIASTATAANPFAGAGTPGQDSQSISQNIERTDSWTEYSTFGGIKIEYKYADCNTKAVENQTLVLFKYTNLTSSTMKFEFKVEVYRNGECYNCARIEREEFERQVVLGPNQSLEGNCNSKSDPSLYLFANFIELSPGMSEQKLTNFKFVNMHSEVVQ